MKKLLVYVDASVVGGCEDVEFRDDSLALWREFTAGRYEMVLSEHTLRELQGAPDAVRQHIVEVPEERQIVLQDTAVSAELAEAYIERGVVGPGSRADALHVALATAGGADVIVSWNFRHIVNLRRIRLFNAVNIEYGYGTIEIRTPKEVLEYGQDI